LLWWADGNGHGAHATTLSFTAFVLFQVFNAFNARAGRESACNRDFFTNRWLWLSFTGVVLLQALVVHWAPAQAIFGTTDLSLANWALAAGVASSVLAIEEARKLLGRLIAPRRSFIENPALGRHGRDRGAC
jgi:Ca2+-transporting ATPase